MADDSQRLVSKLSMLLNDEAALERAFGAPGQAGDPDMLAHLAMRWNSVYEEFFDWAARPLPLTSGTYICFREI